MACTVSETGSMLVLLKRLFSASVRETSMLQSGHVYSPRPPRRGALDNDNMVVQCTLMRGSNPG